MPTPGIDIVGVLPAALLNRQSHANSAGKPRKRGHCAVPCAMGMMSLLALSAAGVLASIPAAEARITKIQITSKESPAFGGYVFEDVGTFEKIVGKAFGELDPRDPKNSNGRAEYAFDFYILKPIDRRKGNHKVMYEPVNHGRKKRTLT